jgi:hypothetical protein
MVIGWGTKSVGDAVNRGIPRVPDGSFGHGASFGYDGSKVSTMMEASRLVHTTLLMKEVSRTGKVMFEPPPPPPPDSF